MTVFWFRRDLRIIDNAGLHAALERGPVLPIFIFDSNILEDLPDDDARVTFIAGLLSNINHQLSKFHSSLAVFYGDPLEIISRVVVENTVTAVYANDDYEPYARSRDALVHNFLREKNIDFRLFKDHVMFEKSEVTKDDGLPYVVFTPYANKWRSALAHVQVPHYASEKLLANVIAHSYPFLGLEDIGFKKSSINVPPFSIADDLMVNYASVRNFPAVEQTSRLGPHLRFGSISIRTVVRMASQQNMETFLSELIWREFFIQILWHFPHTVTGSFRKKYDAIKWRNDELEFKLWCDGKTGYPIVDAGMRQLNATGFMHNRVRMVVASFLCKHLLIDWRWGEAYFASKLLDYEQASNVGNWQWAAGSGVDAAPYFRIFNPAEQVKKFDRQLLYIRRWVPELDELTYPLPIVDHKEARERCLRVYKEALLD